MFKFGKYKASSEMMSTWGKKVADVIDDTIDAVEAAMESDGEDSSEDDSDSDNDSTFTSDAGEEYESGNTGDGSSEYYYDSSQSF